MARPFQEQSLDSAASTGPGSAYGSKGHNTLGLYVIARNLDPTNDDLTVRLEAGIEDGITESGEFATIRESGGTEECILNASDFTDISGDGTYAAFLYVHAVPAPRMRANITTFNDAANGDLSVDAYVLGTNRSGSGKDFTVP